MKKEQKIKKRNVFVALAKFRKSGKHEKTNKAIRKSEKQQLNKNTDCE